MSLSQRSRRATRLSRLVSLTEPRTAPQPLCSLSRKPSVTPSNLVEILWKTRASRSASSLHPQLNNVTLNTNPCRMRLPIGIAPRLQRAGSVSDGKESVAYASGSSPEEYGALCLYKQVQLGHYG